ncbi:hypothetical protein WJX72_011285 [[Myrmecia] bisecta]|uniref:Uncharacterized protein n=1 Tax=[Myrmecia] bisecta TaxID=41462 RepID=A0AAW1PV73_9CHLO
MVKAQRLKRASQDGVSLSLEALTDPFHATTHGGRKAKHHAWQTFVRLLGVVLARDEESIARTFEGTEDVVMDKWPLTLKQFYMVCRLLLWVGRTNTYNSYSSLLSHACNVGMTMKALRLNVSQNPAFEKLNDPREEQNRALDAEVKRLQSELAAAQRRADLVNADLRVQNARLQEEIGAITADCALLKDGKSTLMEANTRANRQLAELRSAKVDGKGRVAAIFANASALGAGVQLIGADPSSAEAAPERESLPVEASPQVPLESASPAPARDASPLPARPGSEPESGGPKALQALDGENKMLQEMLSRLSMWTTEVRRGRSLSRASYDGTSPAPSEGRRTADHSPDGRLELGVDIPAAGLSPGGSRGGDRPAHKSPSRERRVMELLQNCRSDSTSQPRRSLTSHPLPAESDLDAIRPPDSGIAVEEPTPFATPAAQLGSGAASSDAYDRAATADDEEEETGAELSQRIETAEPLLTDVRAGVPLFQNEGPKRRTITRKPAAAKAPVTK